MYIPLSLKFLPLCFQNFHSPLPQPQPQPQVGALEAKMKPSCRTAALVLALALAAPALARRDPTIYDRKTNLPHLAKRVPHSSPANAGTVFTSASTPVINQTEAVKRFTVNGSAIPEVDFHIGESYAGLLPIGPGQDVSELYFWFFPTPNPAADDEIVIWLNGGPGCSSLEGVLQENGPFSWRKLVPAMPLHERIC